MDISKVPDMKCGCYRIPGVIPGWFYEKDIVTEYSKKDGMSVYKKEIFLCKQCGGVI